MIHSFLKIGKLFYISIMVIFMGGIEIISTGIPGLDEMLGGGLPRKSVVEISGTPGSGKTTLAMQFLIEGANKGEKGLYYSFEQRRDQLVTSFSNFGWNIQELEEEGVLKLVYKTPVEEEGLMDSFRLLKLEEELQDFPAERIAFDSINVLHLFSSDWKKTRRSLIDFVYFLKERNITGFFISERDKSISNGIVYTPLDFLFDGIILLDNVDINGILKNVLVIPKMRDCNHDKGMRPLKITKNGIIIDPAGKIYTD